MPRGRPRTRPGNLPDYIDHTKVPTGIYWSTTGAGRWYVLEPRDDGGTRKVTVAHRDARLADLHAIADGRNGTDERGTVAFVTKAFLGSENCKSLAADTQRDYRICQAYAAGRPIGKLKVDRLGVPHIQRLVDDTATGRKESRPGAGDAVPGYPAKANHVLRFLRRAFTWAIQRGHCQTNPAKGVEAAKERGIAKVPSREVYPRVLAFARERGARKPHTAGSCPPYLAPAMELAFLMRLRGIEATTLTEAHALPEGIQSNRRKGSLDNITRWTPRLRAAWDDALRVRAQIRAKEQNKAKPIPLRPEDRGIFLSEDCVPLRKGAFDQAWQALMRLAIKEGVITKEERFTMHGLKHRGVTDTKGTKAQKKDASGHRTDTAFNVYDHDLQVVQPAGELPVEHSASAEFSPQFSPSKEKGA